AEFVGTEDCILFPSAFDANGGVFEALLSEDDAVISDALNHASIIDGVRLCKAERQRFAHADMAELGRCLEATRAKRLRLIVTDGVFSMDGDVAKLPEICALAERHEAMVLVDDSHATGFMGARGRGTHEFAGVMGRVDLITSTLGKALGGASGGFAAGPRDLIEILRQRARPYLFSNSVSPVIVAGTLAVLDLLAETGELREAGIESAVLDADLLLAYVLGIRKEDVYAHPEPVLSADELAGYEGLIARRARGEPVAYLRGWKEFYGLEFAVDPRVLIPRPETELLVDETVRRLAPLDSPLICDLGTGSGAIAIALAVALPRARLIATDSSTAALEVARANASRHEVRERIDFRAGDLLAPIHETLDAVVANLPYLTSAEVDAGGGTSIEFEPRAALDGGADGLAVI